jgi:hypothetical protein
LSGGSEWATLGHPKTRHRLEVHVLLGAAAVWTIATTKDVIAITNLVTKKDYKPWFERYLLGSEWPPLEKGKSD